MASVRTGIALYPDRREALVGTGSTPRMRRTQLPKTEGGAHRCRSEEAEERSSQRVWLQYSCAEASGNAAFVRNAIDATSVQYGYVVPARPF